MKPWRNWWQSVLDIEAITSNGLCAGCGLCAGIGDPSDPAIVMKNSPEGYRRPVQLA